MPLVGNVHSSRWPRSFFASSPFFLLALTAGVIFGDANLFPARVSSQDLSFSCCVAHNKSDRALPLLLTSSVPYGFDVCLGKRGFWKGLQDSRSWRRTSSKREGETVHPATDETDENRKFAQQQIVERNDMAEDLSQLTRLVRITGGSSNQKHQVKCIRCVIIRVVRQG